MVGGLEREFFKAGSPALGPPATDELVRQAESVLGVTLPEAYISLLRVRNGGYLARTCFATPRPTSWAPDHACASVLLGIGYSGGVDGAFGSNYLVREWSYPPVGVVIFQTPSAGHDTIMLDYRRTLDGDRVPVVYVDEDRSVIEIAPTFARLTSQMMPPSTFLRGRS